MNLFETQFMSSDVRSNRAALIIRLATLTLLVVSFTNDSLGQITHATYPGGAEKFYEYLLTNINYPSSAKQDRIEGIVFVRFKIRSDGSVDQKSMEVVTSLRDDCDREALRLIKNSIRWTSASSSEGPIEEYITFPVVFKLE